MADENYTFEQARIRLEEIVGQVRKKDTSLERSLDLLEEGVRLANSCTELIDHTEWRSVAAEADAEAEDAAVATALADEPTESAAEEVHAEDGPGEEAAAGSQVYDYEADPAEASAVGADGEATEQELAAG